MSNKISTIHKSLKIRLYPNDDQRQMINKNLGCARLIYNELLAEHIQWWEDNKDIPKEDRSKFKGKSYKELREEKYPFLSDVSGQALVQAQRNCNQAFSNFFKSISGKRKGKKVGYPKFKSKKRHRDSYLDCQPSSKCLDWDHRIVKLPCIGKVKFRHAEDKSKKWICWFKEAVPKRITVSRNPSGEYWCSILFEKEQTIVQNIKVDNSIGLDFSPDSLYIDSSGAKASEFIKAKQKNIKKLTKLQRSLFRKAKGSSKYEKARTKLARFESHIVNIRKDYIEKESLRLVRSYDLIGIEDLNLQGMMKFSHNAKNYVDTSWGTFVQKLEWKSKFNDCKVIKADRFYPSSKTCHNCGHVYKDLKLSDRTWTCPSCKSEIFRDQNAAMNLRDNAYNSLVDAIKSTLLLEREEVMPMEGIEVQFVNDILDGVSYEVGTLERNPKEEGSCF